MSNTKKRTSCAFCSKTRESALYYALLAEKRLMASILKIRDVKKGAK